MATERAKKVGIIGAGFSGTMLGAHLVELAQAPLQIVLFDRGAAFARGAAYGTRNAKHLLNVRVANMSAYESDPDHFVRWLEENDKTSAQPLSGAFVSRGTYGRYLQATLEAVQRAHSDKASVIEVSADVTGLEVKQELVTLTAADGRRYDVDYVVLCVGNFPPALPVDARSASAELSRYIANPWQWGAFDAIEPLSSVFLIGTGLTMVDVVLELRSRGHEGRVTALSRHGFLPVAHAQTEVYPSFLATDRLPDTTLDLFQTVRREVAVAAHRGVGWRSVIDALRPQTQALWRNLSLPERRRFLRHVRPYWDVHRHRMAPEIADEIAQLQQSARLTVVAGRITDLTSAESGITLAVRCKGKTDELNLRTDWLVNCSGPQLDYGRIQDPLIRCLMDQGLARPDPLLVGLDVTDEYQLVARNGIGSQSLFAIGPPIRGSLWETTAVPDIRKQCEALARQLLARPHRT